MSEKRDTFMIQLALPQVVPNEEETEALTGAMEPFLQKLLDDGYVTKQELAAYMLFIHQYSQLSGFLLDEFLTQFRTATKPEPATNRLVLPG